MANGSNGFSAAGNHLGVNLSFTKFLFVVSRDQDEVASRIRTAGGLIARGFYDDFEADGVRDGQPHESMHFLVSEGVAGTSGIAAARCAAQVSAKYRPRLQETELELRRLGDAAEVLSIDGAVRSQRYASSELYDYAYRKAVARKSGPFARNAFVLPMSKSAEWWAKSSLERHAFFYPHVD
jgi:hypothetical protein